MNNKSISYCDKLNMTVDAIRYTYFIVSLAILSVLFDKNHTVSFCDIIQRSLFIIIVIMCWYLFFQIPLFELINYENCK